ncbi:hypothetical protein DPEC_G00165010 [Dallia pectoralis]|uniref:Uncharacterized protein n=1 Tax=Dallia pectoralis TaxID=75939 RepID=A0ACC2GHD3_DALPE|nr:hypothetical protein DPEC_G00165010 [Dallia pectoralis]
MCNNNLEQRPVNHASCWGKRENLDPRSTKRTSAELKRSEGDEKKDGRKTSNWVSQQPNACKCKDGQKPRGLQMSWQVRAEQLAKPESESDKPGLQTDHGSSRASGGNSTLSDEERQGVLGGHPDDFFCNECHLKACFIVSR